MPLRYHPSYWALVFPLGMYGAATFKMRTVIQLDQLEWAPKVTLAVALTAWAAAFTGLLVQGGRATPSRVRPTAITGYSQGEHLSRRRGLVGPPSRYPDLADIGTSGPSGAAP